MKTTCFQAKQIGNMVHRIDVKFQVTPTSCTSQLSLGVTITIIFYIYINYVCFNAVKTLKKMFIVPTQMYSLFLKTLRHKHLLSV